MFPCCDSRDNLNSRTLVFNGISIECRSILLGEPINENDILIEVKFASFGCYDGFKLKQNLKFNIGTQFAGKVKKAPRGSGFNKRDLVYGWLESGSASEFIYAKKDYLWLIPPDIKPEVACCSLISVLLSMIDCTFPSIDITKASENKSIFCKKILEEVAKTRNIKVFFDSTKNGKLENEKVEQDFLYSKENFRESKEWISKNRKFLKELAAPQIIKNVYDLKDAVDQMKQLTACQYVIDVKASLLDQLNSSGDLIPVENERYDEFRRSLFGKNKAKTFYDKKLEEPSSNNYFDS